MIQAAVVAFAIFFVGAVSNSLINRADSAEKRYIAVLLWAGVLVCGAISAMLSSGIWNGSSSSVPESTGPSKKIVANDSETGAPSTLIDPSGLQFGAATCDNLGEVVLAVQTKASTSPVNAAPTGSRVAICRDSGGDLYYRGARDRPGDLGLSLDEVWDLGGRYQAVNGSYTYTVSTGGLVISTSGRVVSREPAVTYWAE